MMFKLNKKEMLVNIEEGKKTADDDYFVNFKVTELDDLSVNLSDSDVNDIKKLFNAIFDYIVNEKELIYFKLDTEITNLYHDVAQDMINYINLEISSSEENFLKLINEEY